MPANSSVNEIQSQLQSMLTGTSARLAELQRQQRQAFKAALANMYLDEWLDAIFDYFSSEATDIVDAFVIDDTRKEIISRVRDNIELAKLSDYTHSAGCLQAHNFHVSNHQDIDSLQGAIDTLLAYNLEEPFKLWAQDKCSRGIASVTDNWTDVMNLLPRRQEVVFTQAPHAYIEDSCLDGIRQAMDAFIAKTRELVTMNREARVKAFLLKAKNLGVPLKSRYYLGLYKCLVYFDLLDHEQMHSHDIAPTIERREKLKKDYIKTAIARLG